MLKIRKMKKPIIFEKCKKDRYYFKICGILVLEISLFIHCSIFLILVEVPMESSVSIFQNEIIHEY